jgi:hypothetical protein
MTVDNPVTPFETKKACRLDESPPEARWLIKSLWADSGVGVIGGTPKSYKSWLGLEIACAVASGTRCLGHFEVPRAGPTLVYLAEDDLGEVRIRLEHLAQSRGLSLDELDVHVAHHRGVHDVVEPAMDGGVGDARVGGHVAVGGREHVFDGVRGAERRRHLVAGTRFEVETGEDGRAVPELRAVDVDGEPADDTDLLKPGDAVGDGGAGEADLFADAGERAASVGGEQAEDLAVGVVEVAHGRGDGSDGEKRCAGSALESKAESRSTRRTERDQ